MFTLLKKKKNGDQVDRILLMLRRLIKQIDETKGGRRIENDREVEQNDSNESAKSAQPSCQRLSSAFHEM